MAPFPRYDAAHARESGSLRGSRPITVAAHYVQPDWMSRVGEREATLHPRARLDLELDCVWDSASHGSWLKVPPGKLATERTVPLDAATLAALDEWIALAAPSGPCPIPRLSRPADFLFTKRGRRLTAYRLRHGLDDDAAVLGRTVDVTPVPRPDRRSQLGQVGEGLRKLRALHLSDHDEGWFELAEQLCVELVRVPKQRLIVELEWRQRDLGEGRSWAR